MRKTHLTKVFDYLYETQVPASTSKSRHGAFDYGLLIHCWMIYRVARSISVGGLLEAVQDIVMLYAEPVIPDSAGLVETMSNVNQSSILTAVLLHDLNKAIALNGQAYYIPKILTDGKRSEKVPWEINDAAKSPLSVLVEAAQAEDSAWAQAFAQFEDGVKVRDGIVSLAVAEKLSPGIIETLNPQEKFAIVYHDGAYSGRTGLQGKETGLQLVLHFADMVAARWLA